MSTAAHSIVELLIARFPEINFAPGALIPRDRKEDEQVCVRVQPDRLLDVMRFLQLASHRAHIARINVTLAGEVAFQLLNTKRSAIHELEVETGKRINIRGDVAYTSDQVEYACEDSRGRPVTIDAVANRG